MARVVEIRKQLGFTQRDLALHSGLTQQHLQTIEKGGNPTLDTLLKILGALGYLFVVEPTNRRPGSPRPVTLPVTAITPEAVAQLTSDQLKRALCTYGIAGQWLYPAAYTAARERYAASLDLSN
jgi:transcriptional regulator with XRE-family HTH domain